MRCRLIKKFIWGLCFFGTAIPAHAIYESQAMSFDRFETYNRNAFRMNDTLDRNIVRPTTVAYVSYIPDPIRSVIQNFFNNLRDFVTLGNDILQLRAEDSMHNVMRIAINSTFGLLGAIDISSNLGLPQHTNTFGNTLKTYGWHNSSYFVIPFLGPSTVRDTIGLIPDTVFNPTWWIIPAQYAYISVGLFVINGIDKRAKYLDFDQLLYTSIDPYTTLRDTYLQGIGESAPQSSGGDNDISIDSLISGDDESGTSTAATGKNHASAPVSSQTSPGSGAAPASTSPSAAPDSASPQSGMMAPQDNAAPQTESGPFL